VESKVSCDGILQLEEAMLYAIVNNASQVVERVIVWDGKTPQNIPSGYTLIRSEFSRVGARYDLETGMFIPPPTWAGNI
jgi:hypothetical protein